MRMIGENGSNIDSKANGDENGMNSRMNINLIIVGQQQMQSNVTSLFLLANKNNNGGEEAEFNFTGDMRSPPTALIGDQIKMVLLLFLFLVGFPLNATAGMNLGWTSVRLHSGPTSRERLDMLCLKRHLNLADLLILTVYTLSELIWTITYRWRAGWVMCKLVMALRLFSFQVSSNIVVCIAVNRFLTITFPLPPACATRIHIMTGFAWGLAAVLAVPQVLVWTTIKPFPIQAPDWTQCDTVWAIQKYYTEADEKSRHQHSNTAGGTAAGHLQIKWLGLTQEIYNSGHLLCIFWIPLTLITLSYAALVFRLQCLSQRRPPMPKFHRQITEGHSKSHQHNRRRHETSTELLPSSGNNKTTGMSGGGGGGMVGSGFVVSGMYEVTGSNGLPANTERIQAEYRQRITDADGLAPAAFSSFAQHVNNYEVTMRRLTAMSSSEGVKAARRRTVRASVLIVTGYIVFWFPYNMLETLKVWDRTWYERNAQQFQSLHILIILNSVINPFLYGMFGKLYPIITSN